MLSSNLSFMTCLAACLVMPLAARADEEWDKLEADFNEAYEAWSKKMTEAQGGKSGMVMMDPSALPPHPTDAFRPKVRTYAEKHLGSEDALPALGWLVTHGMGMMGPMGGGAEQVKWALTQIQTHYITDPGLLGYLQAMPVVVMAVGEDRVIEFLEALSRKNPNREVQNRAQLRLAEVLFEGSPLSRMMGATGASDRTAQQARAKKILDVLIKEYGDTEAGQQAAALLFSFEHLQVGRKLPDFTARDADGNEVKFSDYRGKVVAVIFWATWCAPCMEMIPHERQLVKELKEQPFVLLGINVDDDEAVARQAMTKEKITWPTVLDGGPAERGSISATWRINHFPTIFIVDHKGIIREKDIAPPMLEQAIKSALYDAVTAGGS